MKNLGLIIGIATIFLGNLAANLAEANQGSANGSAIIGAGSVNAYGVGSIIPESSLDYTATSSAPVAGKYFKIQGSSFLNPVAAAVHPFWRGGKKYQVSSGKTTLCVQLTSIGASSQTTFQILSDSQAIVDGAAVGSMTAPSYEGGFSANYIHASHPTAFNKNTEAIHYVFNSQEWPGFQNAAAQQIGLELWCKED